VFTGPRQLVPDACLACMATYHHAHSRNSPITTSRWCPEEEASWWGRLLFTYVNTLVAKGRRKALDSEELWSTAHRDEAARVSGAFQQQLQRTKDPVTAPQVQGVHCRGVIHTGATAFMCG
jgi:hypothetical protein